MKIIIQLSRIIVGGLFIFSGMVKAIDVQGTAYKLEEYFQIFGLSFFEKHSLIIALIFILLEVVLGVMLLIGYKKKLTLSLLLFTILFFCFLTFYSARYDAVTDCGCFGDFVKLEPWHSFYKDLVLLVMILFLMVGSKYIKPLFSMKTDSIITLVSIALCSFVMWYGLNRLPLIDFRPFAVGNDIREGLYYEKEVKVHFYVLNNIQTGSDTIVTSKDYTEKGIWEDTLHYQFSSAVEGRDSIIDPGVPAKIKNFEVMDTEGNIIKEEILNAPQLMLIVYPNETQYCTIGEQNIKDLIKKLQTADPKMQYLTLSSSPNIMENIPSAILDDATMKQMIRSNPGVLFLKKGIVVAKYHYKTLPDDPQKIIQLYK